MGNAGCFESTPSIEGLRAAVDTMDPDEVKFHLEGGVDVNEAIDDHGNTVYDLYDVRYKAFQEEMSLARAGSEMRESEEARFMQVVGLLRKHGAKHRRAKEREQAPTSPGGGSSFGNSPARGAIPPGYPVTPYLPTTPSPSGSPPGSPDRSP
mmetsp:Transcript_124124/g.356509  ORF Transcript_124124/g.356509 Transcript_124124/m.356509 type:complete len:152 (-) Transcript_124124:210-665(-)